MKFRRGTCGLCKPTKRYKHRNRRIETTLRKEVLQEAHAVKIHLREHHH